MFCILFLSINKTIFEFALRFSEISGNLKKNLEIIQFQKGFHKLIKIASKTFKKNLSVYFHRFFKVFVSFRKPYR